MSASPRVPGVVMSFFLIGLMHMLPRVFGLRRTLAFVRRVVHPATGVDAAFTQACAERVALAAAFYPRRALCLEQSLALFILLRRRGIASELKLGVQPRPFYAHAWVETAGVPVNEAQDIHLNYAAFASLGV